MTNFFDSRPKVKATRHFGKGILPTSPVFEPSEEDRRWWEEESNRLESARLDQQAEEFEALIRLEQGLCC